MSRTVQAVYEKGSLRPLRRLPLKEHERVTLIVETSHSATESTRGIIRIHRQTAKTLAESERLGALAA